MNWFEYQGKRYPSQTIIERLSVYVSEKRLNRFQEILSQRLQSVVLGIEDLYHEHNGAACLRTAEGLGLNKVMVAEIRNAYPISDLTTGDHKSTKSPTGKIPTGISKASHQWIELEKYKSGVEMIHSAQKQGYKVFGAGPRASMTLSEIPCDQPLMLLFGNEGMGLSEESMQACDEMFKIPMHGFTESFNISVSVGMVLQPICMRVRQHLQQHNQTGDLDQAIQQKLLAQWIAKDMKNLDLLLDHHCKDVQYPV